MEYETALRAVMADGHGLVSGLLEAVYTGDVSASKEGFLRYQLLKQPAGHTLHTRLGWGSSQKPPVQLCNHTQQSESGSCIHSTD